MVSSNLTSLLKILLLLSIQKSQKEALTSRYPIFGKNNCVWLTEHHRFSFLFFWWETKKFHSTHQKARAKNLREERIRHPSDQRMISRKNLPLLIDDRIGTITKEGGKREREREPILSTPIRGRKLYKVTQRRKRGKCIWKNSRISLFQQKPKHCSNKVLPKKSGFVFEKHHPKRVSNIQLLHSLVYTIATQKHYQSASKPLLKHTASSTRLGINWFNKGPRS